ncbi:PUA-like domain-containing protein [Glomus cerebriforme]|uniref:PUA-like domain-containing protein n=1 Tax=Glomus cerebriforme TaxID=658196 RepID=A0A397SNP7_9GLOM|nr:PUA-like domain-containing protein [Glomus cerebriforme]
MNIMSLLNTDSEDVQTTTETFSLEHDDNSTTNALAILQYLTCPKCQNVLIDPITFQCGNTLCRGCLPSPSLHTVNQLNRKFKCPIFGCGKFHSLDCKTDVILQKLTEICRNELKTFLPLISRQFLISRQSNNNSSSNNNNNYNYNNIRRYDDETDFRLLDHYQSMSDSDDDDDITNSGFINSNVFGGGAETQLQPDFDLRKIKELLMTELDCQICCYLFIDPITTPCGHSFCKSCITRSLDHNSACPICRQPLHNYNAYLHHPINKTIYSFIRALYPSLYSERRFMLESEFFNTMQDTPMFVTNALVFPKMPCFLHVFEPKYRLMIRRCMQSRQRQFGMVLARGTTFQDYGTMLEIRSAEFLTDGRSLVETIGTYRFRVIEKRLKDGYDVGRIERIDDISPEEEERIEREEIRRAEIHNVSNPLDNPIREYTTSELIGISRDFIDTLRNGNSPWLLQRLNSVYGDMPDDPSDFSYWVASVIPIAEVEKYRLLELRSVRERLKLIVEWITSLRDQWWFARGCSIS